VDDFLTSFNLSLQWPLVLIAVSGLVFAVTVLAAVLPTDNPRPPLAALVGATAGLQTAQIGSMHVFCLAVAAWLVFGVFWKSHEPARWGWPLTIVLCVVPLAATVLTGELVNSKLVAIQLLLLAGMAGCLAAFVNRDDLRSMMMGLLAVTTLASVVAIGQYVGVVPYKVFLGTRRPIGIYAEPDWLGMFSAVGLFLAYRSKLGRWRTSVIMLHMVVLILAAARAAWLAVVIVGILGFLAVRITKRRDSEWVGSRANRWRTGAAMAVLVIAAMVASPSLRHSLADRITGLSTSRPDVSAMARQQQNNSLLVLEAQSPLTGLGLSASGRVGVSGSITYIGKARNNVASDWLLGWWVDGGVLSIPLILLFVHAGTRRLFTTSGMQMAVVLISSLFSNAMLIPIAWFTLGLCFAPTNAETVQRTRALAGGAAPRGADRAGTDRRTVLIRPGEGG
jgi:hypothetical protein